MYVCIVFFMCVLVCLHLLRFVREESRKRRHRMTFVICSHFLINFRKRGEKITHNAHRYTLTHMRRHARTFALISFPCARHTHTYTYTCYLAAVHVLHTFTDANTVIIQSPTTATAKASDTAHTA